MLQVNKTKPDGCATSNINRYEIHKNLFKTYNHKGITSKLLW